MEVGGAAKAGDELLPASSRDGVEENESEDGRKEEEEEEKETKNEEGGDKEEEEGEEGAEQDDSSNHLNNDEGAGVKKEEEEGEGDERPKKGQRGKKPRVREWEKLVLHNDFCLGRSTTSRSTITSVLAGLTKSEEERRKQNEVIAAKERELRRQQRRQNRPLVDSTLIPTQTVVLFVRRDFNKQLAEHLKKQARDK
ncbi:uncharacterized protein ACA1_035280 [Acanthamoeba castellanii str. Neff]|uniref:Uncharacterized protein n=1 Tax=Acanthamoeba castellanii (strain ATCC 30010 / Neff) TaxID=1257118 RepID=L8HBU9_ACACF|nr:uncharacterized protein ACA1_035280 [Acanthamoeba castellanii str. Neff]ELR22198.1 hypothetical protein ACA1_035280 [Acanthamoeba castellanii str. Neff]